MLRKAASRACGTLATRLQQNGSLLENGFQYRSFSTLRQGTRPCFSPKSAHGLPDAPPRRTLAQLYLYMLAKHPIVTKSITASTIYGIADAACQGIVRYQTAQRPEEIPWNVKRMIKAAAIGLFIAGPTTHFWFNFASKVVPAQNVIGTLKKMGLEQLILAPITTATFLTLAVFVQGKTVNQMASELEPLFPAIMKNELLVWPATAFVTYRHVPVHLQPLARNLTFLVWSMFLTYHAYSPALIEAALGVVV